MYASLVLSAERRHGNASVWFITNKRAACLFLSNVAAHRFSLFNVLSSFLILVDATLHVIFTCTTFYPQTDKRRTIAHHSCCGLSNGCVQWNLDKNFEIRLLLLLLMVFEQKTLFEFDYFYLFIVHCNFYQTKRLNCWFYVFIGESSNLSHALNYYVRRPFEWHFPFFPPLDEYPKKTMRIILFFNINVEWCRWFYRCASYSPYSIPSVWLTIFIIYKFKICFWCKWMCCSIIAIGDS